MQFLTENIYFQKADQTSVLKFQKFKFNNFFWISIFILQVEYKIGIYKMPAWIINRNKGPPGQPGISGNCGPCGPPGPCGMNGPCGKRGASGTTGKDGPPGKPGTPGNAGPSGYPGSPGKDGMPGVNGQPGPRGPSGPKVSCQWSRKIPKCQIYEKFRKCF